MRDLWGSALYRQAFDRSPLEMMGEAKEHYERQFSEDRTEVFFHGEVFFPTLVLEDGTVIQKDERTRRAFMSNFVDFYEVERTSRLLETLSEICDVPPPLEQLQ